MPATTAASCRNVTFSSARDPAGGTDREGSQGPFFVEGYRDATTDGAIPTHCHQQDGACTLEVCAAALYIEADTTDGWKVRAETGGDIVFDFVYIGAIDGEGSGTRSIEAQWRHQPGECQV